MPITTTRVPWHRFVLFGPTVRTPTRRSGLGRPVSRFLCAIGDLDRRALGPYLSARTARPLKVPSPPPSPITVPPRQIRTFWRAPANPTSPIGRTARLIKRSTRKRRAPSSLIRRRRRMTYRTGRTAPSYKPTDPDFATDGLRYREDGSQNYLGMMTTTFHHHTVGPHADSERGPRLRGRHVRPTTAPRGAGGSRGTEGAGGRGFWHEGRSANRPQPPLVECRERPRRTNVDWRERPRLDLENSSARPRPAKKIEASAPERRSEGHRPHQRGLGFEEPQGGRGARTR